MADAQSAQDVEDPVGVAVQAVVDQVVVAVAEAIKMIAENKRFTIQWHLTDVCNRRCTHCYQAEYTDNGGSLSELIASLDKLEEFQTQISNNSQPIHFHINFTGGEPFLKPELLDLLQEIKRRKKFTFGILSNGFLLPKDGLAVLKTLNPKFIQLSLEGDRKTNDRIRGEGAYNETIKALDKYHEMNIPTILSFTASSENYNQFASVVNVAKRHHAAKVWTDRCIPSGANSLLQLTKTQAKAYFSALEKQLRSRFFHLKSKTIVSSERALQFLTTGGNPYQCSAGDSLLALMPNWDIFPCRRLPIKIGNINTDDLIDLYTNHPVLKQLQQKKVSIGCEKCHYNTSCNGGLKCLSHAVYGDFGIKDPNCWL